MESWSSEHILVAQLPNPGYRFTLDVTRERFNGRDVFVTLRRPNPVVLYAQVVVEQRLATSVRPEVPITVYARLIDYEDTSDSVAHSMAAESAPKSTTSH